MTCPDFTYYAIIVTLYSLLSHERVHLLVALSAILSRQKILLTGSFRLNQAFYISSHNKHKTLEWTSSAKSD